MKKILLSFISSFLLAQFGFSQTNNPYNKIGVDVISTANVIFKDYKDGKIKDINQPLIDQYFKTLLPDYPTVKLDDFTKILNTLKSNTSDSAIKNSGYSDQAKAFLTKSLTDYSTTALVEDVKKSRISESEKKNVLCVLAINYNLASQAGSSKSVMNRNRKGPNAEMDFGNSNDFPSVVESNGGYSLLWGVMGFIIGNSICGLPCGIVGGVAGLILGSNSNSSNTTIHGGGGNHYSSGWPTP